MEDMCQKIYLFSYYHLTISIPGNLRPSSNSNDAPPPVDICVNLFLYPILIAADAVSPPPIIVVPDNLDNISHNSFVPLLNSLISNTPTGPFQTTVLDVSKKDLNNFTVL